ncbi:MAG TPA: ribonuclease H-like domain-containing protein [Vicinamibacterales bacterium]
MIRPGAVAPAASALGIDGLDPADVLGGAWREVEGQRFVVVERAFRPGHRHGRLSVADSLPPSDGVWPTLDLLSRTPCRQGLLFVDLETTGLMGGAGTYAFLVGCAWFDGGTFRMRQYLMSSVTGERGLLLALADLVRDTGTVVTYNGKSFDLPLIETRFLFHRMTSPFAGMPHVDMLHPARRLWRPLGNDAPPAPSRLGMPMAESACRLTTLERTLWGFEREGDVPGYEIPERYFAFVRSGDARPLDAVLEHNRLDLLSLACVTAHACQMLDAGPFGARSPREALGLGRIFLSGGRLDEARECFAAASGLQAPALGTPAPMVQVEALRAFALVSRRQRRFDEAAAAWQRVVDLPESPAPIVREATEALAVHYEHRRRDIPTARSLALQALTHGGGGGRESAIRHRVARLDRKLGVAGASDAPASLF